MLYAVELTQTQGLFVTALLMALGGLCLVALSSKAGRLATAFWWAGMLIAVLGLILILFPVLAWLVKQLTDMLGLH